VITLRKYREEKKEIVENIREGLDVADKQV
jgi:hypothetical protein